MSETITEVGKQASLADLLEEFHYIQIPIIQRDYAQGRTGLDELRHEFLMALRSALEKPEGNPPLDLDFVYGSGFAKSQQNGDTNDAFAPLDGQQRLTTLFLLHWYLAWKDERIEDFAERFVENSRSLFSYEVRPSSHDFFNRLVTHFPDELVPDEGSVRKTIEDKPWFFRSWTNDPTIVSALVMLDEIHKRFADCVGYYDRLIDSDHPRVTFQLLELKNFGLSDDLYIKMNARGKALTPFENFKAKLEQHLDELLPDETRELHDIEVSVGRYFSHRMDTDWTDLFWRQRDSHSVLYDQKVMRLIKAVALVSLDPETDKAAETVTAIKALSHDFSYSKLTELNGLSERMLITLLAVLDHWAGLEADDWAEKTEATAISRGAFLGVIRGELTYPELTNFAAFCSFVLKDFPTTNPQSWHQWHRVISNLVENSDIERPSDFVDVLKSIRSFEEDAGQILKYLADGNPVTAFSRQQIREERIKAALILENSEWDEKLYEAEGHGYFNGQIEFLLKFCGILDHWIENDCYAFSEDEDREAQSKFSDFFTKANLVFDSNGLRPFEENLFERALLAIGDYTLPYGMNRCFLLNRAKKSQRIPTWKQLLRGNMLDQAHQNRRDLLKQLLDQLDAEKSAEESFRQIINDSNIDETWRKLIVESPEMLAYCSQKMIRRFDDGRAYLISKLRTSSEHAELRTYHLYRQGLSSLDISPFVTSYSYANTDEYNPSICLRWSSLSVEIDFITGSFRFACKSEDEDLLGLMCEKIGKNRDVSEQNNWQIWRVQPEQIGDAIMELVSVAEEVNQLRTN